MYGPAILRKVFLVALIFRVPYLTLRSLMISMVYRAAIAAVVVARAGTIFPAFILTVIQSIEARL